MPAKPEAKAQEKSEIARVAIIQSTPRIGDIERNKDFILQGIRSVDADFLVFGEMFLSGYLPKESLSQKAQKPGGKAIQELASAARKFGKYVIFGAPLADEKIEGRIYNAAILIHPDGRIDHYAKMNLPTFGPFEEKWYFASGEKLPVFETKFGKVGLQICYDIFFPEITKAYSLQGADIVFCISASPSTTRKFFEAILPARAIESTVFMVYSNLVGPQDKLVFWGGGCAVDPRGNIIAKGKYFDSEICIADIDLGMMGNYRRNRPTIVDSKMENYLKIYDILRQLKV